MFTKCPSCHADISFEAPVNAPAGYKHRIKCPSCGVTMSVNIPSRTVPVPPIACAPDYTQMPSPPPMGMYPQIMVLPIQGMVQQGYPQGMQQAFPPGYLPQGYAPVPNQPAAQKAAEQGKKKRVVYEGSRAKSLVLMILSALFLVPGILGYLMNGNLVLPAKFFDFLFFDGISVIMNLKVTGAAFFADKEILDSVLQLVTMLNMAVAALAFLIYMFGLIFNFYGKSLSLTITCFQFVFTVASCLTPYFSYKKTGMNFMEYLTSLTSSRLAVLLVLILAAVYLISNLIIMALKKKPVDEEELRQKKEAKKAKKQQKAEAKKEANAAK